MATNRRTDTQAAKRSFCFILCFVTVVIIALLCVIIFLAVKKANCEEAKSKSTAMIQQEAFGKHEGQEVMRYTLKNKHGVQVKIINYGGIITNIMVPDKNGDFDDITLGFDDMAGYSTNGPYLGAIIGRYANRIANGEFVIDGQTYNVPVNNGPNALHGGIKGFDKKMWDASVSNDALLLKYVSADGEEGYPGEVTAVVKYQLTDDNELIIEYSATTTKTTVINLTNHAYFNLAGQGSNQNVFDHFAMIKAKEYTPINNVTIPTGVIAPVKDTLFDLTTSSKLGDKIPSVPGGVGYDHNYCFGKTGQKKYMARVEHPGTGRFLEMYSTEPGVQFYTAYYLNETGKGGATYGRYGAFCLEAQHYPNSPNQPNFPSTELEPADTYLQTTIYKFGVL